MLHPCFRRTEAKQCPWLTCCLRVSSTPESIFDPSQFLIVHIEENTSTTCSPWLTREYWPGAKYAKRVRKLHLSELMYRTGDRGGFLSFKRPTSDIFKTIEALTQLYRSHRPDLIKAARQHQPVHEHARYIT